ncbi:MAG TPA: hypothetical protein VG916_14145, partial [Gemmatimonadaceae bacterium]|nr:hypothetical protein [Gemmatimonadaceae bacterium]
MSIPVGLIGLPLRHALYDALRTHAILQAGQVARGGYPGEGGGRPGEPESVAAIARAVIRLHDAEAIPSLASVLWVGPHVSREIVRLGEPGVLLIADSAEAAMTQSRTGVQTSHAQLLGYLIALRIAVEDTTTRHLSPGALARLRTLARAGLTPGGLADATGLVINRIVDLAVALDDGELRTSVERLSSDRNVAAALGAANAGTIAGIQAAARERLAGVPARPRP